MLSAGNQSAVPNSALVCDASFDAPMRRMSSELNTAHIYDGSTIMTPTGSFLKDTGGDTNKASVGAFFTRMPDNTPSMSMRGLGA
jgi:hypothetical protein